LDHKISRRDYTGQPPFSREAEPSAVAIVRCHSTARHIGYRIGNLKLELDAVEEGPDLKVPFTELCKESDSPAG
jgi:uncharacterized OB-fold protein